LSKEATMMKRRSILAIVIVGSGLVLHAAQAQQPGVKRTELHRVEGEGLTLSLRRSPDWIKMKNPACEAARREAEEDWGK
jgi:hypothetical protein